MPLCIYLLCIGLDISPLCISPLYTWSWWIRRYVSVLMYIPWFIYQVISALIYFCRCTLTSLIFMPLCICLDAYALMYLSGSDCVVLYWCACLDVSLLMRRTLCISLHESVLMYLSQFMPLSWCTSVFMSLSWFISLPYPLSSIYLKVSLLIYLSECNCLDLFKCSYFLYGPFLKNGIVYLV